MIKENYLNILLNFQSLVSMDSSGKTDKEESTYFSPEVIYVNITLFLRNCASYLRIKISLLISEHSAKLQVSIWKQVSSGAG